MKGKAPNVVYKAMGESSMHHLQQLSVYLAFGALSLAYLGLLEANVKNAGVEVFRFELGRIPANQHGRHILALARPRSHDFYDSLLENSRNVEKKP